MSFVSWGLVLPAFAANSAYQLRTMRIDGVTDFPGPAQRLFWIEIDAYQPAALALIRQRSIPELS